MYDFLNPENILNELDIKDDMLVVDLGSGSGRFSISLAKRIKDGLVWAVDIQKEPLVFLKSYCQREKIHNINVSCCDLEQFKGTNLSGSFFDLALAVDILFQTKDISAIISEAKRILKNKGVLFVSERFASKTSPFKIIKAVKDLGFVTKKEINLGEKRYGLIFEKN